MALVCTTKVENKIHKNAGSLLEWPVIARIRSPIAKTGITQDMITKLRSDSGQKKVITTTHRKREG